MTRSSKYAYLPGAPMTVSPKLAQKLFLRAMRKRKTPRPKPEKVPAKPQRWHYSFGDGRGGIVQAMTRGEARAAIKRECGISRNNRLPIGIEITQVK